MTVIVGLVEGGVVYMGGDRASLEANGYGILAKRDPKVFRNGEFIMGVAGSARVQQVLRFWLGMEKYPLSEPGDDLYTYMVTEFVEVARAALEAAGIKHSEGGRESIESYFLVGYKGALFQVLGDFYVQVPLYSYAAVGSGDPNALGALFALEKTRVSMSPVDKIRLALEAACEFNSGCRPPFDIVATAPVLKESPSLSLISPCQGVYR